MALAIWDITTITSPTTLYGSAVRWVTIPDPYAAIGYMMTTTPVFMTNQYGLYFEYVESTTPNWLGPMSGGGTTSCCMPIHKLSPRKVRSYQKGTRSFVLDCELNTTNTTAVLGVQALSAMEYSTRAVKRLILYYRSMNEFGETPA